MKRFLFVLLIVLYFTSCSNIKKDYWICLNVIEDNNTSFIRKSDTVFYTNTKQGSDVVFEYFLIPETNKNITITDIIYNNDIIELIENKTSSKQLIFKTINKGKTSICIKTKEFGITSMNVNVD